MTDLMALEVMVAVACDGATSGAGLSELSYLRSNIDEYAADDRYVEYASALGSTDLYPYLTSLVSSM